MTAALEPVDAGRDGLGSRRAEPRPATTAITSAAPGTHTHPTQEQLPLSLACGTDSGGCHRSLAGTSPRSLGAYYTPPVAAMHMARWAMRRGDERVLEPSVGDGAFVGAVSIEARRLGVERPDITGVELAVDTHAGLIADGMLPAGKAILADFMSVPAFPVDVVIGNPPYVRLRHLPEDEAARARTNARGTLGVSMSADGSLWMPFVLHAMRFLAVGGRLAFVLPQDATYVRYARPLWRHLAASFGSLRVVRVHQRLFPAILQDVVLLFADRFGGSTSTIGFEAYRTPLDLIDDIPLTRASIDVGRVVAGERAFVEALLPHSVVELLRGNLVASTVPVRERVAFNIGYVSGDKRFFHPSADVVEHYRLPPTSLQPTLTSSRVVAGSGLRTTTLGQSAVSRLFLPPSDPRALAPGERRYIDAGARTGVDRRYKCRVRDPWYVTPDVRVPDVLLPVFTDRPRLLLNDARLMASNSLLAGFLKSGHAERLAASWYTSLTLLELELRVHSLGGGVLVLIPGEVGSIRVCQAPVAARHLGQVDARLAAGRVDEAYEAGDATVLREGMGLTRAQIESVVEGLAVLRHWRTGRDGTVASVEHIPHDQAILEGLDDPIDERADGHVEVGNGLLHDVVPYGRGVLREVDDHVPEVIEAPAL